MAEELFAVLSALNNTNGQVHTRTTHVPKGASDTRSDVFNKMIEDLAQQFGVTPRDLTPTFFTVERNEIR